MSQDLIRRFGAAVAAAMLSMSVVALPVTVRADDKPATPKPAVEKPAAKPAAAKEPADVGAVKLGGDQGKGFLARHEGFLKDLKEKDGKVDLLLVGDSITDGFRRGGKAVVDEWAKGYSVYNIGISGDRTQHVIWRLDNGEVAGISPKVAMLMIGTNNLGGNTDDEIAAGVTKIVKQLNEKLPKTKVLLLGVFPRNQDKKSEIGKAEDPIRARIKHINEAIAKLDDGGKTVKYLDIGDKFLDKEGGLHKDIMPDFLHPNAAGYEIWSTAVTPAIKELAGK